jgi:hypothetical protein
MVVFFILDSGSDWGQGTYLTQSQGFDTVLEGQGEEGESLTDSFPQKIKVIKTENLLINLASIISFLKIVVYLKLHSSILSEERIA